MGTLSVLALRVVLGLVLAGSLFVQVVMVPLVAVDLRDGELAGIRLPLVVIAVLGVMTIQVTAVCVWRLVTMVRRGTVFSRAAFRFVDIVIGAVSAASLLILALAVVLALRNRAVQGDVVAPGIVLLMCGVALLVAGVALIVFVQRMLLAQAIARDAEARDLRTELDEVI